MLPNLRTQEQFVENEVTAIQAQLPGQFQFGLGSILLALVEAHGRTAVWEQSLVQFTLAQGRLSTSTGTACDTFVQDFGYRRLQGNPASGEATFSSFTPTAQRIIPALPTPSLSAQIAAAIGGVSYYVSIDTSNDAYNEALGGYVIAPGDPSVTVPIISNSAGTAGNTAANGITVIISTIVGVDIVTNQNIIDNGINPNTDTQLRANFVLYLQSLARATQGALDFALQSLPGIFQYKLVENINYTTGDPEKGQFWAVIDNGEGEAPSELLAEALANLYVYKGFTIIPGVYAPDILAPTIAATIVFPSGYTSSDFPQLLANIKTALQFYANLIPFGETFFYSRISGIIFAEIFLNVGLDLSFQFNVTNVLLAGSTADIPATQKQRFIIPTGSISLTPSPG